MYFPMPTLDAILRLQLKSADEKINSAEQPYSYLLTKTQQLESHNHELKKKNQSLDSDIKYVTLTLTMPLIETSADLSEVYASIVVWKSCRRLSAIFTFTMPSQSQLLMDDSRAMSRKYHNAAADVKRLTEDLEAACRHGDVSLCTAVSMVVLVWYMMLSEDRFFVCCFIHGSTIDLTWESKLSIEPSEGESNRIADSWNWTSISLLYPSYLLSLLTFR